MLDGKSVNLRVMEREDVDFATECYNNIDFQSEFDSIMPQRSKTERLKMFDNPPQTAVLCERQRFTMEKKDGIKIGFIAHWLTQPNRMMEIGYDLIPDERGKGYGTEAIHLIVDYLFLTRDIARIQAITNTKNKASQRILEKTGFKRERKIRKAGYARGKWVDAYLYSALREDWKKPRILTTTSRPES